MGTEKCPLSPTMEITSSGRVIIDANNYDRRVEGTSDWCRHKGFGHRIPASDKKEHTALWWRPSVSKCEIRRHKTTLTSDTKCKWHHWLDGCEFEQVTGIGDGQGSLVCCSSWGHKELDTTEQLYWTEDLPQVQSFSRRIHRTHWKLLYITVKIYRLKSAKSKEESRRNPGTGFQNFPHPVQSAELCSWQCTTTHMVFCQPEMLAQNWITRVFIGGPRSTANVPDL